MLYPTLSRKKGDWWLSIKHHKYGFRYGFQGKSLFSCIVNCILSIRYVLRQIKILNEKELCK